MFFIRRAHIGMPLEQFLRNNKANNLEHIFRIKINNLKWDKNPSIQISDMYDKKIVQSMFSYVMIYR